MRAYLILPKAFSCFLVQSNGPVSGPLVASYRGLAISPKPRIQIRQNPAMPKSMKMFSCLWGA